MFKAQMSTDKFMNYTLETASFTDENGTPLFNNHNKQEKIKFYSNKNKELV